MSTSVPGVTDWDTAVTFRPSLTNDGSSAVYFDIALSVGALHICIWW